MKPLLYIMRGRLTSSIPTRARLVSDAEIAELDAKRREAEAERRRERFWKCVENQSSTPVLEIPVYLREQAG